MILRILGNLRFAFQLRRYAVDRTRRDLVWSNTPAGLKDQTQLDPEALIDMMLQRSPDVPRL